MTVNIDIRTVESTPAGEIYITACPESASTLEEQARDVFSAIRKELVARKARILQERVFASSSTPNLAAIRSKAYGDISDGVPPAVLIGRKGLSGPLLGVQVHAVCGGHKPQVISHDGRLCGRVFKADGRAFLTLSAISAKPAGSAVAQARTMLEKAETVLKKFGADCLSVPRTWMWLGDILSWYGDFNKVRNDFFGQRGLIGKGTRQSMPASTGIGLALAEGPACGMDLIAVLEPADSIKFLAAVGKQQCALEYGSAFSRASRAVTPAGETVFVSGTASIDASGATTNIGNINGQIEATIDNVRAVLKDMNCRDEDVVQAVAYCKTAEVEKAFAGYRKELGWPCITAACDICRDDLLFEIEATAMPRK